MSELLTSVPMTACPGTGQRETTEQELSAKPTDGAQLSPPAQSRLCGEDHPVPSGKWVDGVSRKRSVQKTAHLILSSRLSTVLHWLPLAAYKSSEDVEYVHQLRVATRRAGEAFRMASDLLPESALQVLRARLREIRSAAGEARNLDVLLGKCLNCAEGVSDDACRQIADAVAERRRTAQGPVIAIHETLLAEQFADRIESVLSELRAGANKKFKQSFGRRAPSFLKPAVRKFFKAAKGDLSDDEAFHELRLRTQRLRYTMEHVAVAFEPRFKNKLYAEISSLQDLMGAVNDHATAKTVFGNWIRNTDDVQQRAFLRGMLLAQTKAHADLRQAFHAIWTPKVVKRLRRQFRDYCGRFRP